MTKIDTFSPSLAPLPPSELEPARRLIVLIPDMESDYLPAIGNIWELANTQHASVLLLGLYKDMSQELSLRRGLITLCAMVQAGHVLAKVQVEMGTSWVSVVKRNYQKGDMIVCFAEQRAGLLHKPLSQILRSNLKIPVHILSGLYTPKPKPNLYTQIVAWTGFLGILAGFFVLQIKIDQVSEGGLQNILLILSIIPEFWLILAWNGLFG
jgi:hypothetical protein